MAIRYLALILVILLLHPAFAIARANEEEQMSKDRIQIHSSNPRYWEYEGELVLLLGGSVEDNLFQIPDLKEHLNLLASVGGNYIRNVMSSRDDGNVQPFMRVDAKYDLEQWNDEYWNRFQNMLKWTEELDIVPQIEVWAFHDVNQSFWEDNPWRPANNISYTTDNTTLRNESVNIGRKPHEFFFTVPKLNNDEIVLRYQRKFVDKILSYSLQYDHVLYCMTNEIHTQFSPEWGWYWAGYIREKADGLGKRVELSEMYWKPDLRDEPHRASLDHPEIYSYFEGSQNSAVEDQENWDNLQFVYHYLDGNPRPINHTKIYGADTGTWPNSRDRQGTESFWRNIIGGSASSRFHRPITGIGLSEKAQSHIRSMRMLTEELDIFRCVPDSKNALLSDRDPNEAYLTYINSEQYAVYFPDGGSVRLDLSGVTGKFRLRWLDIANSRWADLQEIDGGSRITLAAPGPGHWAALLTKITSAARKSVPITGTLRVSGKNPRYFTDGSGRAIYLTGSHTWANLQELRASPDAPNFDYEAFLDFMQEYNHNFMRMWAWEQAAWTPNTNVKVLFEPLPYLRTGPGNALDGGLKFDLKAFNEDYFSRLRSRVVEASRRGIYVSIMLFEGFSICDKDKKDNGNPWKGHPLNAENNINGFDGDLDGDGQGHEIHTLGVPAVTELQEAYVREVIDTVNDLDNVLYEVANEDHGGATEWQYHIIDFIHNYEADKPKQHPVLMTFQWDRHHIGDNAALFKSPAEAISPNHEGGYRNNPPAADGTKVIISDTDHLWGIGGDRAWVWKTFCRGMNPIFMDPMGPQPGNGAELPNPNDKPEFESIRRAMGHTLSHANRMDLMSMVPRNDLSSSRYCLADPGKEYLIYLPDGGEVIVDLSAASGAFTVEWFNPKNGEAISSEAINGGKSETFIVPFDGDAVLYIRKLI